MQGETAEAPAEIDAHHQPIRAAHGMRCIQFPALALKIGNSTLQVTGTDRQVSMLTQARSAHDLNSAAAENGLRIDCLLHAEKLRETVGQRQGLLVGGQVDAHMGQFKAEQVPIKSPDLCRVLRPAAADRSHVCMIQAAGRGFRAFGLHHDQRQCMIVCGKAVQLNRGHQPRLRTVPGRIDSYLCL